MPEKINDKTIFTLLEVTKSIQKTLSERYKSSFWVKAEMNKLNYYKQSGHCYPELVEKQNGKVIAQIKSHLWKDDFIRTNNNFLATLKEPLKDGIKILFLAKVSFDPAHGLALWIIDIDPSYTLGDLEKEKQESIKQLKEEGVFNKNKILKLPLLPQRIAIISVETSKGYADFIKVIETNPWRYKFFHLLFPSLLQGDQAVNSILTQLKRIRKVKHHFDVVAIIRGGGGDVGLSCYNNYQLAKEIALFPIPVITGIGHATNETVVEMVSFSNAITPTKLAEYLLQKFHNFSVPVQEAQKKIIDKSLRLLNEQSNKFQSEIKLFKSVVENILISNQNDVINIVRSIVQHAKFTFKNEREYLQSLKNELRKSLISFFATIIETMRQSVLVVRKDAISIINQFKFLILQRQENILILSRNQFKGRLADLISIEKNINNMSPKNVLKRGYSITQLNGKSVKNISEVKSGDSLKTIVFDGNIISIVKSSNPATNE